MHNLSQNVERNFYFHTQDIGFKKLAMPKVSWLKSWIIFMFRR